MSGPVKSMQLDFLSNKDNEHFFLSDDSDDAFNFKYVSKSQIKSIIRDVKRHRRREKEERNWASLAREEDSEFTDYSQEDCDCPDVSNVKKMMRESMEEVDQELRRLKKDSLPERKKGGNSVVAKIGNAKENSAESPKEIDRAKESAGSLNILLTIPEEMNTSSACERSPISKLECSARKSHSAGVLRPRIASPGELNRATNDYDCNYSSGSAERFGDSEDEETCNARPHPVVAHRILGIQKKISDLLDEIALRLNRIPLPDGDRDLLRRQQRVAEFAIRFSRNYLYDLGRQIADVNRHVRAIMPSARVRPTRRAVSLHMQAIEQKLTTAHQLLLHALDAYCKHVPSSVLKGQPGKLKEILQVVVELKDICAKIHLTSDYYGCGDAEAAPLGEDTEKRCSAMLVKLHGVCSSDNESRLVSRTAQSSPIGGLSGKRSRRVNGADNCRRNFPSRLAMYSSDTRLSRPTGSRKLLAPPRSRERGAQAQVARAASSRRPTTPELPDPSPTATVGKPSRDAGKRRKTRIRLPLREDEISTMMSTLATDSDAASSISVSGYSQRPVSIRRASDSAKCSRKQPSEHSKGLNGPINAALVADDDQRAEGGKRITDRQLSSLVPVIADLMTLVTNQNEVEIRPVPSESLEALVELLKKYRTSDGSVKGETNCDSRLSREAKNMRNSRGSMKSSGETNRGAKNMQLICLTAGEDVASESCYEKVDRAFATATKNRETAALRVSETSVRSLLKYREDYQQSTRSNPMYTNNSENKPWDVVAWIADKLVNELIHDVSEEFEMKDTIRELFALEFKEFKLSS